MSEAVFKHVRVTGKKFERASIVLDNMWFENCSFVSVVGLGRSARGYRRRSASMMRSIFRP